MKKLISKNFCAVPLAIAGLLAAGHTLPATAANWNEYRTCAARLQAAGISPQQIGSACAEALRPREFSICVLDIKKRTTILGQDALSACSRVRRPADLASCVTNINRRTKNPPALAVLDYCRRSLLPTRFSECVIGLSGQIDFSPSTAMESCIAATDYPGDLSPRFPSPRSGN